jgi:hypothetical protein
MSSKSQAVNALWSASRAVFVCEGCDKEHLLQDSVVPETGQSVNALLDALAFSDLDPETVDTCCALLIGASGAIVPPVTCDRCRRPDDREDDGWLCSTAGDSICPGCRTREDDELARTL